jgi:hypothetical protein
MTWSKPLDDRSQPSDIFTDDLSSLESPRAMDMIAGLAKGKSRHPSTAGIYFRHKSAKIGRLFHHGRRE